MSGTASASIPSPCPLVAPVLLALALIALGCARGTAQPPPPRLYAYCSVGDNQWVPDWPPVDSQATVDAMFEWLAKTYHIPRMYWRGEQDRMWLEYYSFRREIPLYYDWWTNWVRYLTYEVGVDEAAVAAAKRNGMEIYVFEGVLEHACQGDVGGCGMFPYQCEDRLRIEHPEWIPVDRWGERVCAGPIEFCYPEARRALVERYVHHVADYGYDGIAFYTYVENMGIRYVDEFGFNEPIVQEFKRRYGVDIRTEPFDKEAWYRLRGEYFTQFLRELHEALAARGKKLSMSLQSDNPNFPQPWYGTQTGLPGAGMLYLDWETWVREGIVDELIIWTGADKDRLLARIQEVAQGKPLETVVLAGTGAFDEAWRKPFVEAGCALLTVAATGQGPDKWSLEPTSLETLRSDDWMLRAQTLLDIEKGTLQADGASVAALAADPHVIVRRQAIRTLGAIGAADQVAVIENALGDPESSVRIQAAAALGKVNGPDSAAKILAAVADGGRFQLKLTSVDALAAMKEKALPALLEGLSSPSEPVREVCVRALDAADLADALQPLVDTLKTDADYRIRFWAVRALAGWDRPEVIRALLDALSDGEPTVQLAAATALGDMAPKLAQPQSVEALDALTALFREYGEGCAREDAAWGWRPVGNAIKAFGQPGLESMEAMRTQQEDKWLAWYAYEVVHVPQEAGKAVTCDERDALDAHGRFAPPFPGRRR
jgi:HEAT repeat protein